MANVTPEQAPKSGDKSHSGIGILSLLREGGWLCLLQPHQLAWLPFRAYRKMHCI